MDSYYLQDLCLFPGYPVRGGFGHSSVWDDITNRIYVYGGYVSTASTAAVITNTLYSLDPITKHWKRHSSSSSYRYLHSAVASSGLMIVFGGNTHNDTSVSHGAKVNKCEIGHFFKNICVNAHFFLEILNLSTLSGKTARTSTTECHNNTRAYF